MGARQPLKKRKVLFGVEPTRATLQDVRAPLLVTRWQEAFLNFEKAYFTNVLKRANGNISEAAKIAGIYRSEVYARIKRHEIDVEKCKVEEAFIEVRDTAIKAPLPFAEKAIYAKYAKYAEFAGYSEYAEFANFADKERTPSMFLKFAKEESRDK